MTELTKKEMLAQMAHLFFAYHDIFISDMLLTKRHVVLSSKERIPVNLREKFFDKFEFDKNMELNIYNRFGKFVYDYTAPKTDAEKRYGFWLESNIFVTAEPIMYLPKGE